MAQVQDTPVFLSTLPPGRSERRLAFIVVVSSVVAFLIAAVFAKVQLPAAWAFIPVYQSALVINDLITAILLFGQFRILRTRGLLLLASGYLFTGLMAIAHLLTFPGLFAPTGLLGAGPQSTAWLYMFWHAGFPVLVIAYALIRHGEMKMEESRAAREIAISLLAVMLAVVGFTMLATVGQEYLPSIMQSNRYTPAMIVVVTGVWALSALALFILWRHRPHSVLDLWLMVVMCAWIFDIALAAVLNGGRFDFGFYAGRLYGLLAASFVLVMLLLENVALYVRLAEAHTRERQRSEDLTAANRELEAFSYSVSHDLRAPVRAVDGFAQVLEEDHSAQLDAEGRRLLSVIRKNSARMGQLIDDLLAFSRLGRQSLRLQEAVALEELVRQTIEELRPSDRQINFSVSELGAVKADPGLLKQVLVNLLSNAIKFTRHCNAPVIEVGCRPDLEGDCKIYYVKDNGAGFDMCYVEKLFGVFQRLHSADQYEGTGVGLAIVQRIVQRHGGRIWAESQVGAGATFYFTLRPAL